MQTVEENNIQIDVENMPDKMQVRRVFSKVAMGFSMMLIAVPILAAFVTLVIEGLMPGAVEDMNTLIIISMLSLYPAGIVTYRILNKRVPGKESDTLDMVTEDQWTRTSEGMIETQPPGTFGRATELQHHDTFDSITQVQQPDILEDVNKTQKPPRITALIMAKLVLVCLAVGFILNLLTMGINYAANLIAHFREVREITQEYIETGYGVIPELPYFMEVDPLMDMIGGMNPVLAFLFIVVATSFFEEFLFRKLLYDKLIVFGGKVFILVSSLLFALFHMNHHQLLYAFGIGLVFAGVMYYTKKVSYCIILHMFFNFFGLIAIHIETMPQLIESIYMFLYFVLLVIGIVLLIRWLISARRSLKFEPAQIPVGKVRNVFLNPGMIIFLIITISSMFLMQVA